jgi:hypothetical protein
MRKREVKRDSKARKRAAQQDDIFDALSTGTIDLEYIDSKITVQLPN